MPATLPLWFWPALATALTSLFLSWGIVKSQRWHARWSVDSTDGPQQFHPLPTPRIGGIGPFVGLCAGAWALHAGGQSSTSALLAGVLAAGLLAFVVGLLEDVTKKVGVKWRLLATMGSGVLAWHFTGSLITRVDVWGFDSLLQWLPFAVFFTAFAIGGLANAINIIDGFNGLASGVVVMIFAATGFVAQQLGDAELATISWLMMATTAGFWLINFPRGPIFLGDGGAYFLGFVTAWMVVILVARHPQISPWFAFLACGYPVIETFFSIWRKARREGHHPGQPDRVHFHMLVYARVAKPWANARHIHHWANPLAGLLCQAYALLPFALTLCFYARSSLTLIAVLLFAFAVYGLIYRRLSRFAWRPGQQLGA
jgi:UDP-N-acetylmuramyl pentapeptide phosphotransferase/UDP-N-acetylglucosamine-1-phosphate transferase